MKKANDKELYILRYAEIERVRGMISLLENAIFEIIDSQRVRIPEADPFGSAQSDLIEEESFIRQRYHEIEEEKAQGELF